MRGPDKPTALHTITPVSFLYTFVKLYVSYHVLCSLSFCQYDNSHVGAIYLWHNSGEITQILLCLVLRKLRNHNDMELMFFEYKHQSTISGSQSQNVLLRPQSGHILISSVPTHSLLWLQVDKHVPAAVTESCKLHVQRAHCELLVLSGSLDVS